MNPNSTNSMPLQICERGRLLIAGLGFFGDPFGLSGEWTEENEIGRLWHRYMTFMHSPGAQTPPIPNPAVGYELWIEHADTRAKGFWEIFVGQEIADVAAVPVELSIKALPATMYAVLTLRGEEIASDWQQDALNSLANAGFKQALPYSFQSYDHRFKGMDKLAESEIDIYIPIRTREEKA